MRIFQPTAAPPRGRPSLGRAPLVLALAFALVAQTMSYSLGGLL